MSRKFWEKAKKSILTGGKGYPCNTHYSLIRLRQWPPITPISHLFGCANDIYNTLHSKNHEKARQKQPINPSSEKLFGVIVSICTLLRDPSQTLSFLTDSYTCKFRIKNLKKGPRNKIDNYLKPWKAVPVVTLVNLAPKTIVNVASTILEIPKTTWFWVISKKLFSSATQIVPALQPAITGWFKLAVIDH